MILGCVLIAATTAINMAGVRLLARINNVGVIAELVGVVLLIGLLVAQGPPRPGHPARHPGAGRRRAVGLSRAVPGRGADGLVRPLRLRHGGHAGRGDRTSRVAARPGRSSRPSAAAALAGALLIVSAILAVGDPARPELGRIAGGLPMIVKDVLGPGLGAAVPGRRRLRRVRLRPGRPCRARSG